MKKVQHQQKPAEKRPEQQLHSGYIPPDEAARLKQHEASKGKGISLREKIKITSGDIPIRIGLQLEGGLRKRTGKVSLDNDPNNYDYDLDELIEDETKGEAKRAAAEFYSKEPVSNIDEDLV